MKTRFFRCKECGNIVELINDGSGTLVCCGQPMIELKANTSDGAKEKHVPFIIKDGDKLTVKIGSIPHPMTGEHYIQWVAAVTDKGIFRKELKPGDTPEVSFCCLGTVVAVYEYCNLHGLWKIDL